MSRGFGARSEIPGGVRKVRCVLWTPRGKAPPRELKAELGRKGIQHRASDNAHGAMALIVGWGATAAAEHRPVRVLILVEPSHLDGVRELLGAAERYVPEIALWVYSAGANPTLRALVEGDMPAPISTPHSGQSRAAATNGEARAVATPRVERRPMPLRLADGPAAPVAPGNESAGGVRDDGEMPHGSQLTDEELAMLLGDEPTDGHGTGRDTGRGR